MKTITKKRQDKTLDIFCHAQLVNAVDDIATWFETHQGVAIEAVVDYEAMADNRGKGHIVPFDYDIARAKISTRVSNLKSVTEYQDEWVRVMRAARTQFGLKLHPGTLVAAAFTRNAEYLQCISPTPPLSKRDAFLINHVLRNLDSLYKMCTTDRGGKVEAPPYTVPAIHRFDYFPSPKNAALKPLYNSICHLSNCILIDWAKLYVNEDLGSRIHGWVTVDTALNLVIKKIEILDPMLSAVNDQLASDQHDVMGKAWQFKSQLIGQIGVDSNVITGISLILSALDNGSTAVALDPQMMSRYVLLINNIEQRLKEVIATRHAAAPDVQKDSADD